MQKYRQIIFFLLIMNPIIDIVTSLSTHYLGSTVTIGALLRALLMIALGLYIFYHLYITKSRRMVMYIISIFAIIFMFIVNIVLKQPYVLFQEVNFILKTSYYVVMIFSIPLLINQGYVTRQLILKASLIIALIVGITYWVAIASGTSIPSYANSNGGYSGWFFAANELSVSVIIILTLSIVYVYNYPQHVWAWIAFLLILFMGPMIGTKTAFFGCLIILFMYVSYMIFKLIKRQSSLRHSLLVLSVSVMFVCFIPFSPISSNTNQLNISSKQIVQPITYDEDSQFHTIMHRLLSSRDIYFLNTYEDFTHAHPVRQMFGLGYAGNYVDDPKLIEMDFFDLFFSYGWLGSLALLTPLLYATWYVWRKIQRHLFSFETIILCLTLGLSFVISFLAGHVLFAPSVMTYVTIVCLMLGLPFEKGMES